MCRPVAQWCIYSGPILLDGQKCWICWTFSAATKFLQKRSVDKNVSRVLYAEDDSRNFWIGSISEAVCDGGRSASALHHGESLGYDRKRKEKFVGR